MVIVRRVFDGLKQSERERVVMVEVQYVACYKGLMWNQFAVTFFFWHKAYLCQAQANM